MMKSWTWIAMVLTLAICAVAPPAHAQLDQTWVASNGLNSNPCSRSQPCADFATAFNKTNNGGQIGCVDSGQYGPVTITKAVSIDCTGVQANVFGIGITVTVPGGTKVVLRGLIIQGFTTAGMAGISLNQGGALYVDQCIVRGFGQGIALASTNGTAVYVNDTTVFGNAEGISVQPSGGPVVTVALDRVHVSESISYGMS